MIRPWQIYTSVTINPGEIREIDFGGQEEVDPESEGLDKYQESRLTHAALEVSGIRNAILESLNLPLGKPYWMLLHLPRHKVLPNDATGVPGDFDIVVGPIIDGFVAFEDLSIIEVKRRAVKIDGTPKSLNSGLGESQARGAVELGVERVLLMHLVVGPDSPAAEGMKSIWRPLTNASLSNRGVDGTSALLKREILQKSDPPFGIVVMGWGRAPGANLSHSGALSPNQLRAVPFRPLQESSRPRRMRQEFEAGLRKIFGERRPGALLYAFCRRCGSLAGGADPHTLICACKKPAFW